MSLTRDQILAKLHHMVDTLGPIIDDFEDIGAPLLRIVLRPRDGGQAIALVCGVDYPESDEE
jgi:hypothetical protein